MHSVLAARTDFSVGESILTTQHLVDNAKAAGATAVAMTDTMSITGMIDFTNRAKKAGLKPIIGTRLRLVDDAEWRPGEGETKKQMPRAYFLTLYALTEAGMKAIFRLLTLANSEARFYYEAKIGFDDLLNELGSANDGDVAIIFGDAHSILEHPEADRRVDELMLSYPFKDRFFAPLVPIDTPYYTRLNQLALAQMARRPEMIKPIVVRPAFYGQDEADAAEVMSAIVNNNKVTDGWHRSTANRDFHVVTNSALIAASHKAKDRLTARGIVVNDAFKQGILNTKTFVDAVKYVWSKAPVSLPTMAPDEFAKVLEECKAGWSVRFAQPTFGHQPTPAELSTTYKQRLAYELSVLKRLNFSGYFLLVQDVVNYAKTNGILVGPGRGSVGGSLVAYLMGITDCDPVRFGLLFERFINPERIDLPDADLDFMSERRHEIVEYLTKKYGEARVAGVSNFGTLAAASSIRDVGRVVGMNERDYSVSKYVPKKHGANVPLPECRAEVAEIDNFANNNPAWWPIMERLEGTIRNFSQHAAGIVVGGVDLVDRAVVERRKDSAVVCWDKVIVEDMGLVKMDILGLRTLDLIKAALDHIFERHSKKVNLMRIALDDPKVLQNFADARTTGVFQFESGGMRRLLKDMADGGDLNFDDITAATALYRPGPMESGMMDSFAKRKAGHEAVDYDHPIMEPVLKETFGVIVYQEQVMKISQVIAGYTGAEADKLRKIMGKKLPAEMAAQKDKFVKGCIATIGCTEDWAGALFDKIEGFAGYGFNKSHSVEYTLISYQSMWLKTYYPVEFFAAALTLLDEDKLPGLIRDAKQFGIYVSMPDINVSTGRFEIATDTQLVIPFQRVKGISGTATDAILEARKAGEFASFADFLARVEKRKANKRVQEALDKVGAFSRIEAGQPKSDDPSRIKDQIELIPGLVDANVPIDREFPDIGIASKRVSDMLMEFDFEHGTHGRTSVGGPAVRPAYGKDAKFMIIMDAPNGEEESSGKMGVTMSAMSVVEAMFEAGLERSDAYWTSLLKRPKRDKQVSADELTLFGPYLQSELQILKPPVIVLLGTTVVRHFFPDFRGKASDAAGKVVYSKDLDANVVIGFSPGEIYYAPEKQENMNAVFAAVAGMVNK